MSKKPGRGFAGRKQKDNFPTDWNKVDLQETAEIGDIARKELARRGIASPTQYQVKDLVGWQDYEQRIVTVAVAGHWAMLFVRLHAAWSVAEGAALAGEGQKLKET